MLSRSRIITFLALPCLCLGMAAPGLAAQADNEDSLHGQPWAFGHSSQRNDAIWSKGISGDKVEKRAHASRKRADGAADTTHGIDQALNETKGVKGSLGMSMANESGTWKVTPDQKGKQPDEHMFRDRRHVVRAFADVKAGEDLNISVGPELILKDERHGEESATEDQPDSALGVGMRFKFDF